MFRQIGRENQSEGLCYHSGTHNAFGSNFYIESVNDGALAARTSSDPLCYSRQQRGSERRSPISPPISPRSVINTGIQKMPGESPPPKAPPALDTVGTLGVILHCQNRSCRHRAWLDPPSLKGVTTSDLERRAKCSICGMIGCSAEVISPTSNSAHVLVSDTARAVRLRKWIQDHPVG